VNLYRRGRGRGDRVSARHEAQSPPANLLSEYSIFFNQVIDDAVLMLFHPSSNASDEK